MPEELRPLRGMLSDPCPIPGRAEMLRGWLAGRRILLATTGDGARNARAGVAEALSVMDSPPTRGVGSPVLIVIGVAGALSPDLSGGDLVAITRVVRERGGDGLAASPSLLDAVQPLRRAVAVTAERIADSVAEKQRLLALAQPEAGVAAVVDLESAAFAEGAQAAGVPWLILRAVSDTADEALPELLNRALDDGGAVDRGRVLVGLLGRPSALPALLGLRRRVKTCAEALADGVALALRQVSL
jgi:adenosylhomocysteine nucleosidase